MSPKKHRRTHICWDNTLQDTQIKEATLDQWGSEWIIQDYITEYLSQTLFEVFGSHFYQRWHTGTLLQQSGIEPGCPLTGNCPLFHHAPCPITMPSWNMWSLPVGTISKLLYICWITLVSGIEMSLLWKSQCSCFWNRVSYGEGWWLLVNSSWCNSREFQEQMWWLSAHCRNRTYHFVEHL